MLVVYPDCPCVSRAFPHHSYTSHQRPQRLTITSAFLHITSSAPESADTPYALGPTRTSRTPVPIMMSSMSTDSPWMFAATQSPTKPVPALALARAGGPSGTTYLYTLDDETSATGPGSYSALAAGAKRWV